jgi:pimeloyl-ACP methyl ester carboxylesterase
MTRQTIFMIHGMFGGSWCWDNYRAFFERRGERCLAPSLRHHDVDPGADPHPDLGSLSLDEKPVIMGHSMGGLIAQILGSRGLASALVLLAPAAPAGIWSVKPTVVRSIPASMIRWGAWKRPVKSTFESTTYSAMHLLAPRDQRTAYSRFVPESGRAAFEIGLWFLDARRASAVDEKRVDVPVLVVSGAEDRITPPSVHWKIARKYAKTATYMGFARHAHWIFGEPGWEGVASHIHLWLNQRSGGGEGG